jgi:hypothetical protein
VSIVDKQDPDKLLVLVDDTTATIRMQAIDYPKHWRHLKLDT